MAAQETSAFVGAVSKASEADAWALTPEVAGDNGATNVSGSTTGLILMSSSFVSFVSLSFGTW